jgi:hypothetical protein
MVHTPLGLIPYKLHAQQKQKGTNHVKTPYHRDWCCDCADFANGHEVGHTVAHVGPCTFACVLRHSDHQRATEFF